MNSSDLQHFEKPLSYLCVISEDEKTFQGVIRWYVPNCEIKTKLECVGKSIRSTTFSIGFPPYCSFYFLFYPNGKTDFERSASVTIIFNRKLPNSAWVNGQIHLDGVQNSVEKTFSVSAKDFDKEIEICNLCHSKIIKCLVTETDLDIIMRCSVKIKLREIKCTFDKEKTCCYAESRNYDSNKESTKYNLFADVTISLNDLIFMTHKTLLAQIPYFRELFDANESEAYFELTNIEPHIFRHILLFLYSGDIPQLYFKLACELYIVAHDLNIFDLKNLCSSYLGANLTETNVVMVLKISHECEDIALKKVCFAFIKKSDVEALTEKSIIL